VNSRYTVVVWLGNPRGDGAASLIGVEAAAPVALSLLSAIDPVETIWPATDSNSLPRREQPSHPQVTLISPTDGAEVIYDSDVASGHQKLMLRAAANTAGRLYWFIDGRLLDSYDGSQAWWIPTRGAHSVRVADESGHAARAQFLVR
jgi:membrane carboxypeptidase/penicillin-binding protein PbpC